MAFFNTVDKVFFKTAFMVVFKAKSESLLLAYQFFIHGWNRIDF